MSVIWDAELFEEPVGGWVDGVVASSGPLSKNPLATGLVFAVKYEAMVPDGNVVQVGYTLQALIEEEVAPGVFIPVMAQFSPINNNATKGTQILVLQEGPVADQGTPEGISIGFGVAVQINRSQLNLPPTYRLSIVRAVVNAEKPDLDSLVVSGYTREIGDPGM